MERYEAYKDSGVEWIGEIPSFLTIKRNRYVLRFEKGRLPRDTNTEGEGVPYIGAGDLDSNTLCQTFTTDGTLPTSSEDDLLILWDGARAGICGIGRKGAISSTVVKVTCNDSVDRRFLYWYYKAFEPYVLEQVHGTTIPHMNRRYVDDIGLLSWDRDDQHAISDYLDAITTEIDALVADCEQEVELLQEYRRAIISETVTNGLDPDAPMKDSGVEWIGAIPASWKISKLRYCGSTQNGISKGGEFFGAGFPFVSYGNVYRNELDKPELFGLIESTEGERERYRIRRGDVLFTRTSETIEEVGIAAGALDDIDNSCFAGFLVRFRPIDDWGVLPEYAAYYFRSDLYRPYLTKEMILVTRASLSQQLLGGLMVLIPPADMQEMIVHYLDSKTAEVDALIDAKRSMADKLREYRKSLIFEAVTGKFKVPGV